MRQGIHGVIHPNADAQRRILSRYVGSSVQSQEQPTSELKFLSRLQFNLFKHPNSGLPALGAAGVGIIGSVLNNKRQIQMAMKLYF
jgi:hypothetical protein